MNKEPISKFDLGPIIIIIIIIIIKLLFVIIPTIKSAAELEILGPRLTTPGEEVRVLPIFSPILLIQIIIIISPSVPAYLYTEDQVHLETRKGQDK